MNLKLRKSYTGFEYFWSRDMTWMERNGHHFHLHFLLVLDGKDLGEEHQLERLQDLVFSSWAKRAASAGFGKCSRNAFFLEVCQQDLPEEQIARYTAKLTKAAFEAVSHEYKSGDPDRNKGLTPWQVMEQAWEAPEGSKEKKVLQRAWFAFKNAVAGRRSYGASRGFWKLAELRNPDPVEVPEPLVPDAVEVMASCELEKKWEVYMIGRRFWKALAQLDLTEEVQDFLELGTCGQLHGAKQKQGFQELVHACGLSIQELHTIEIREWTSWAKSWTSQYLLERVA